MKKIKRDVLILLFAVLFAAPLFAGFSGSVNAGLFYDADSVKYGFLQKNAKGFFTIDLYGNTLVKKGRGSVYAEAKAMLGLGTADGSSYEFAGQSGISTSASNLKINLRLDYARIIAPNIEVGLLAVPGVANYAYSPIDTYLVGDDVNYASLDTSYASAPGMYFKYRGNTFGFGIEGVKDSFNITLYGESSKFTFGDNMMRFALYATKLSTSGWNGGASLKYAYVAGDIYATLAIDSTFALNDDSSVDVNAEVAGTFGWKILGVEAYYGSKSRNSTTCSVLQLISAKVTADWDSLGLPLRTSFTVKDVLAMQDMSLMVGYRLSDSILLSVTGGFVLSSNGRSGEKIQLFSSSVPRESKYSAAIGFVYDDALFSVYSDITVSQVIGKELLLGTKSGISSSALVPGAEFSVAWNADDILKSSDENLTNGHLGKIEAICKIAF